MFFRWSWVASLFQFKKVKPGEKKGDFPGGPAVRTWRVPGRGHRFNPWLGN